MQEVYWGILLVVRPVGEGKKQDWAHLEGELQCNHNNRFQLIFGELYSLDGPLKLS